MTALVVLAAIVVVFLVVAERIRDSRARWLGQPGFPADSRNKRS